MDVETHAAGSFCTSVLRTRDLEGAVTFYGSLMGWTLNRTSDSHAFFQWKGKTVASVQQIAKGRSAWVPQVSVENIELTSAQATALGATHIDTIDIEGVARTATFRDPEDTFFGLWQPAPHQGAQLFDEVGSLWWIEILVNNVSKARDLYSRLFGWTAVNTTFEPFASYVFFNRGDKHVSGILPIDPNWGIAPRWNSIFAVEDCDGTVAHGLQLGAREEFVHTVPTAGRIGVFRDPGGAAFLMRGPVPR
jgi:predicted enzyme related to lactoylglutathione lyase